MGYGESENERRRQQGKASTCWEAEWAAGKESRALNAATECMEDERFGRLAVGRSPRGQGCREAGGLQ